MKRIIFAFLVVFLVTGCQGKKAEEDIITIGEINITPQEFEESFQSSMFATDGRLKKEDFLEIFIARKLMLKEAEEMGLDKDPGFLSDIQLFWEQSLLKRVLARKMKALAIVITVNDREVKDFYEEHKEKEFSGKSLKDVSSQIETLLFRAKQQKAMENWVEALKRKTEIKINYDLLGINETDEED